MTASTLTKLEGFFCSLSQFTCLQQAELVIYFMVCPKRGKEKNKNKKINQSKAPSENMIVKQFITGCGGGGYSIYSVPS